MPSPTDKQADQARIVASLASEFQVPIAEVTTLYEHERDELALSAHITQYLHLFAMRNVHGILQQRDRDRHTPSARFAA